MNAGTRLVGLIGDPVEHSLSPLIHNTAFREQDINAVYAAMRVRRERLGEAVGGLLGLDFMGANVTVPHKQAVVALIDELSPQAHAVGAVNTIVCRHDDGTLYGDNTDVAGFVAPIARRTDELTGAQMTIIGSGGAARAVAYALLTTFGPSRLTLAARTPSKAERLASDLSDYDPNGALAVEHLDGAGSVVRSSQLVVNATPVGMYPRVDRTPWPDASDFGADHVVYDIVYNPERTRLLREAEERGATTVGGLDMLVEQAAASYVQWTDRDMPVDVVKNALRGRANR
ncbi:MAG: shikimate dehydrogenase [Rhodothermales bacterium]